MDTKVPREAVRFLSRAVVPYLPPGTDPRQAIQRALMPAPAATQPVESLLTYRDVAIVLQRARSTIWRDVTAGRLPVVRFGRNVRFRRADVEIFTTRGYPHADHTPEPTTISRYCLHSDGKGVAK